MKVKISGMYLTFEFFLIMKNGESSWIQELHEVKTLPSLLLLFLVALIAPSVGIMFGVWTQ